MKLKIVSKLRLLIAIFILGFIGIVPPHTNAWVASGTPLSYASFASGINYATQIAIDSAGNVYQSGYQGCCTVGNKGLAKYNSGGVYQTKFGAVGSMGVAVDPDGNIIHVDYQNDNIEKFTNTGTPISIAGTDLETQVYSSPYAAAVDSLGNIYIANAGTNQIFKFNSALAKIATITGNSGAFSFPETVAVDGSNNLYVNDSGNNRVQKFDSSGTWLLTVTGNGGAFNYPEALTVDTNGNIYVGDSGNNRIQIFDTNGVFQQEITSAHINTGTGSPISYLSGMGFKNPDTLFVGDQTRTLKIVFDHNDPTITVNPLTGDDTTDTTPTITGTATDTTTVITNVEYSVDAGAYTACVADDATYDELSETFSCTISPALSVGAHTIDIRGTDSKYNVGVGASIANYPFTVSAATPTPSASSSPTPSPSTTTVVNTDCSAQPPDSAPNIFKISRSGTEVNIFYSPISSNVTSYQLMYGYKPADERFAATFNAELSTGAMKYTVSDLVQTQSYAFWLRGVNDCMPGPWSNTYTIAGQWVSPDASPIASKTPLSSAVPTDGTPTTTDTTSTTSTSSEPTIPTEVNFEITIVDPLGLPLSDVPVSVAPSIETIPSPDSIIREETSDEGTINVTVYPGEYTITTTYNNISYSQGMILSATTTSIKVEVPIPLKKSLERQILDAPIDASYAVKAGVAGIIVNSTVASFIGLFVASNLVLSSLFSIYTSTSRSFLRLPFDYLDSLIKFTTLSLSTKLAPIFPAFRRKKKSNGLVFDAYTFKPIQKVYVLLFSSSGNLKTDFTDADGRYNFEDVAPDDYQLRTEMTGYKFPSTIITSSKTNDIDHVYLPGEILPVSQDTSILKEVAVPMDPSEAAGLLKKVKFEIARTIKKMVAPSYLISMVLVALAVYTNPSQFNQVITMLFGSFLLVKANADKHFKRMSGQVQDPSKLPIVGAVVKLYKTYSTGERSSLYTTTKTDKNGRYYIQPEIGNYILEILTNEGEKSIQTVRIMKNVPTVDRVITLQNEIGNPA